MLLIPRLLPVLLLTASGPREELLFTNRAFDLATAEISWTGASGSRIKRDGQRRGVSDMGD